VRSRPSDLAPGIPGSWLELVPLLCSVEVDEMILFKMRTWLVHNVSRVLACRNLLWFLVLSAPVIVFFGMMNTQPAYDPIIMMQMGDGFAKYGEFLHPYFLASDHGFMELHGGLDSNILVYSHHYPPLYPAYLGLFYKMFGFSLEITKVAAFTLYVFLLFVVYFTSNDLLRSREKALMVTALVGLNPWLIFYASRLYSEPLVIAFFTLTVWAILKGLKDERYLLLAGLFAGLGYLTKSSVGYFFILAGVCGFLWRFYYMRWEVFRNKYYLGAIAIFAAFVFSWALRNIMTFGWPNWETSNYVSYVTSNSLVHLDQFILVLVPKLIFLILLLLIFGLLFLPELRNSIRNWRDEENSGLWLAVFTVLLIGSMFSAAFYLTEETPILWADNFRYILCGYVPLIWLGMKYLRLGPEEKVNDTTADKSKNGSSKSRFGRLRALAVRLDGKPVRRAFMVVIILSVLLFLFIGEEEVSFLFFVGLCVNFGRRDPKRAITVFLVGLFIISANTGSIITPRYQTLEDDLRANLGEGDTVAYTSGLWPQTLYLLPLDCKIKMVPYNDSTSAAFVITRMDENLNNTNYSLFGTYYEDEYYYGYVRMTITSLVKNILGITKTSGESGYKLYIREVTKSHKIPSPIISP
jgi:4-amino-4-deoxy-L-arabinose transferase-like glycosyltransferase